MKILTKIALFLFSGLLSVSWSCQGLARRLTYPPGMDQDAYLAAGVDVIEDFTFMHRAPVYSAWVGGFYAACGRDLHRTFLAEKIASVALLSMIAGLLAWQFWGLPVGMLMGWWVANCRYLLLETNGSHVLAASLYLAAVLCLVTSSRLTGQSLALLLTYLSSQVRSEMWVPLAVIVVTLAIRTARRGVIRLDARPWAICASVWIALVFLFSARTGPPERNRLAVAFGQNYSVGYVEQNHLIWRYPNPWESWRQVWAEALPGTTSPVEAARHYPWKVAQHLYQNVRMVPLTLLSLTLRLDGRFVTAACLITWGLLAMTVRTIDLDRLATNSRQHLLLWSSAVWLLVPISIVLRVAARYYIQLLPFALLGLFALSCRFTKILTQPRGSSLDICHL